MSADPEALGRFEREARAVGALSNPNIISIHDVGTEGGVSYVAAGVVQQAGDNKIDFSCEL